MEDEAWGGDEFKGDAGWGDESFEVSAEEAKRNSLQTPYQVYSLTEVSKLIETLVNDCSQTLGLSPDLAKILLRCFRWDRDSLFDAYLSNPEKVLHDNGLETFEAKPEAPRTPSVSCPVCLDDVKVAGLPLSCCLLFWLEGKEERMGGCIFFFSSIAS